MTVSVVFAASLHVPAYAVFLYPALASLAYLAFVGFDWSTKR